MFLEEAWCFLDCIAGLAVPPVDGRDGLRTLKGVAAAVNSSPPARGSSPRTSGRPLPVGGGGPPVVSVPCGDWHRGLHRTKLRSSDTSSGGSTCGDARVPPAVGSIDRWSVPRRALADLRHAVRREIG